MKIIKKYIKKLLKTLMNLIGEYKEIKNEFEYINNIFLLFGKEIIVRSFYIDNGKFCTKIKIFKITIFQKDYFMEFVKSHKKTIQKYDEIYILNSNLGEVFLFFTYCMNILLKNKDISKILFLTNYANHIAYINLVAPKIEKMLIKDNVINYMIYDKLNFKNQNFILLYPNYVYQDTWNVSYFDSLLRYLKIQRDKLQYNSPNITQNDIQNVIDKTNIKNKKFVIFMPEAESMCEIDTEFWINLYNRFKKLNIEIFWNLTKENSQYKNYKHTFLNIAEIMTLSCKAQAIVTLRSGLSEILCSLGGNHFVIYENKKTTNIEVSWFDCCNFSVIPNPNNSKYFEYIYNNNSLNIIDDIIKNFLNLNNELKS